MSADAGEIFSFCKAVIVVPAVIASCFVSCLFSSCSKSDGIREEGGTQLHIGGVSLSGSFLSGASTKSSTELTSGSIGVFRLSGGDYVSSRSNVEYSYSGGAWNVVSGVTPVYLTKSAAKLCAYYPYSSSLSSGVVNLSSGLYSSEKDFCYQTGVSGSSSSSVSFELDHAYSQITFVFTHKSSYSGSCVISNISISNSGILTSNTLDISTIGTSGGTTGTYGSGTAGTVSVNPAISSIASGASASVAVLMVPTVSTLSGTIDLSFTVDGKVLTTSVNTSDAGLTSLEAGKNYNINVNIYNPLANCYIISPGASLTIPVDVRGNGGATAGTGLGVVFSPASVGIVWESSKDLISISDFSSSNKTVKVTTSSSDSGNAVIAAYSGSGCSGDILWSWHIWVTNYDPDTPSNGTTYSVTNSGGHIYTFMDRNLGATTATAGAQTSMGLYYQWGRKDPFPPSSSVNSNVEPVVYGADGTEISIYNLEQTVNVANNLANSILHPDVFYKGLNNSNTGYDWYTSTNDLSSQNGSLWGGANKTSPTGKTIFDPCPAGWRVPASEGGYSPWSILGADRTAISSVGTFANYGVTWSAIIAGFWPAAGYRMSSDGSLISTGTLGVYWSASASSFASSALHFSDGEGVVTAYPIVRAYGFSVRCVKE